MARKLTEYAKGACFSIGDGCEVGSVIEELRASIESLESDSQVCEETNEQIVTEAIEIDNKIISGEPFGLPFPWEEFQDKTFGIPFGAVCPLAGRDKKGKSRLAAFLAHYWISRGYKIAYFPFEDRRHRLMRNLAASEGGYDLFTIKSKYMPPQFMEHHKKCMERVSKMPITIYDHSSTMEQICARIRTYVRRFGIQGVVIDGFKDVIATKGENRTQQESHMMQTLVNTCGDTGVACMPIVHLNKIDPDEWITANKITGSGRQTQSARMRLFFQDAGFSPDIVSKYDVDEDRLVCLDCDAASYGSPAKIMLEKKLDQGCFIRASKIEDIGDHWQR